MKPLEERVDDELEKLCNRVRYCQKPYVRNYLTEEIFKTRQAILAEVRQGQPKEELEEEKITTFLLTYTHNEDAMGWEEWQRQAGEYYRGIAKAICSHFAPPKYCQCKPCGIG